MDAIGQRAAGGEFGGHRRADEGAAVLVEAVAERGVARQHDVDDALGVSASSSSGRPSRKQR